MPILTNAPEDLVALVVKKGILCPSCADKHPELLDDPNNTVVLQSDAWKDEVLGDYCLECHEKVVEDE